MRRLLPLLTTAAAIATATVATVAITGSANAAPAIGKYVALGDSYAAVGSLDNIHGDPIGCARATDNYPSGVAVAPRRRLVRRRDLRRRPDRPHDTAAGGDRRRQRAAVRLAHPGHEPGHR